MRTTVLSTLLFVILMVAQALPAHANVENFSYSSWDTHIELVLEENGRATAHVTETLVAQFPDHDQNKGIVRGIPMTLHGAPAGPDHISVTDETGAPYPFFIEEDDDFRIILTGTDEYVRGEQTYVIQYDIPDPIFQPSDAAIDEFYWDMVSVDRRQPIDRFSASLSLDPELASALTGDATAYVGTAGSTATVPLSVVAQELNIDPIPLGPNETVSFAVGFVADTVTQPNARTPNFALDALPALLGGVGVMSSVSSLVAVSRMRKRHRTTGRAIIAQYDVPNTMPPLLAAQIRYPKVPDAIAAQFLHLAVQGHMRIEERLKRDGSLHKKPRPVFRNLTVNSTAGALGDPLDRETLDAVFTTKYPELRELPKASTKFASSMTALAVSAKKASDERGYFTKRRSRTAMLLGGIALVLLLATAGLVFTAITTDFAKTLTGVAVVLGAISVPFIIMSFVRHRVHTPQGAEAYEYLDGVKLFIEVAEADRIQMLQSHSGAERNLTDGVEVLHLYERLLPYAVLFGLEREWTRVLQVQYEAQSVSTPYWYPYLATRGIGALSDSVSTISNRVSSAASYTASSSSGSSGGGFAGGGGGGGFSGGR